MQRSPTVFGARGRLLRAGLRALGAIAFALGALGLVLPLLPTTVFWILAVACFSRSDPRLAGRLLAHPRFGPGLRAWFDQGALSRRSKLLASLGLALGWGGAALALRAIPAAPALLLAPFGLLAGYLWSRPLPRPEPGESPASERAG